jgi:hypothetical protein
MDGREGERFRIQALKDIRKTNIKPSIDSYPKTKMTVHHMMSPVHRNVYFLALESF